MECYTSDSCDSDSREQKTLDLCNQMLNSISVSTELSGIVEEKDCAGNYEIVLLNNNRIKGLPDSINKFCNLKILDISNNRLTSLPDILESCPLTSLIAKHNQLTNESLPKCFSTDKNTLRELNLSGNYLNLFPEQLLELTSLRYLYIGGNKITNIPRDIWKLNSVSTELSGIVEEKDCAGNYEIVLLNNNRIKGLPDSINKFCNLKILDISNNRLTSLPDILESCPLTSLIAKHNQLTNESLPKCFSTDKNTLRELNLSGNYLNLFPEQLLELTSLRYLYIGGNKITNIPRDIWKLNSLQILSAGGNQITDVPEGVGRLTSLQALFLSDNLIEQLPSSIANLKQLRSLLLHKNRLKILPTQIIKLKCLNELSLRDNPLVVRFVSDMTLQPPTLLELAGRTLKLHEIPIIPGEVPATLINYLSVAQCCVNPKCKGVFFDTRVEHIKFVDFCGKYRIPLLQYLCSSKCITGSWESREVDYNSNPHMMSKVLLG